MAPTSRGLYWTAVGLALAAVAAGAVVAVRGYLVAPGPRQAVQGYFAALERGDAPAALGYGALPAGPHTLLTSAVLREQQAIAPIRDVRVTSVARQGATATVSVRYTLGFAAGPRDADDTVQLVHRGRTWRLAGTAVRTRLRLDQASDRARVAGAGTGAGTGVPAGAVLLFPGAVPISFDTPDLQLAPASGSVALSSGDELRLAVRLDSAGRRAVLDATTSALQSCLSAGASPRCPLPSDRYVPGSLRATITAPGLRHASLALRANPAGVVEVSSGTARASGRYTILDFDNQRVTEHGSITVPVAASVLIGSPPVVEWTSR